MENVPRFVIWEAFIGMAKGIMLSKSPLLPNLMSKSWAAGVSKYYHFLKLIQQYNIPQTHCWKWINVLKIFSPRQTSDIRYLNPNQNFYQNFGKK